MIDNQQFLTPEESLEVEKALLTSSEKFLTRLTISSLRLLQVIAQDFNIPINDLTSEQIITWMETDSKKKIEEGKDQGVLKW
ncbi:MAG: hypothetical protein GW795_01210 [Cyanobacteria bacterium]|nr:hypothetical protein [Cyanobacteria bacterium CG_2015-16_32_12]NCO77957.1 hypothetical protein [Cyanobacteria bacterium CG_2015-22_32_23]NCQ03882.1 hypothetical protein [Cyanobacteria bacterium CG_2015-09_32_10]NCQ40525.1 hypothetical protein [Cyanobacteria bacterium CG_2015-04_32_10]NCS85132.1 hypothetical protein [Cyanobacteria bacterium CG_2015-02_32_10]